MNIDIYNEYPYFSTTVRFPQTFEMTALESFSAGMLSGEEMPSTIKIYKMEYLLALDAFTLRRIAKEVQQVHASGMHVAFMAQHISQFDQLSDRSLRDWMGINCLMITNTNLLESGDQR